MEPSGGASLSVGPLLEFPEVQRLVEAVSPAIRLEFEGEAAANPRGRYLVARRDIEVGEAFLSERPLFCGGSRGERSRKAYSDDFAALLDSGEEGDDFDEDAFHPRSPLTDCLAGIVRAKWQALHSGDAAERKDSALRIRKLSCLWRVREPSLVEEDCARDVFGVLRPELQEVTSPEEIFDFMTALCSNRFGGNESKLDLMFAGSMFEHSCLPNCFVGTWRGTPPHQPRCYRALRDISEGEALSIDYLHLPETYLPAPVRIEMLARWGFACSCARCTSLPELGRCFSCPQCAAEELCPARPDGGAALQCRACGASAGGADAEARLAAEAEAEAADIEGPAPEGSCGGGGLLGRLHWVPFLGAWARVAAGPAARGSLAAFRADAQLLTEAISRLHGDPRHPHLLDLYHMLAQISLTDLDEQRRHLEREREVLRRYYPEEAVRLDEEIMHLIQGRGPFGQGEEKPAEDLSSVDFGTWEGQRGLEAMD